MPPFGPIKRRDPFTFSGMLVSPVQSRERGMRLMARGDTQIALPNPHQGDISRGLLARILRDAGISREEWERLS